MPLDSSKSLHRFRKELELSSLPMGLNFDEMLENSLGTVEGLFPDTELIELLGALANKLDELLYPPDVVSVYGVNVWKTFVDCFLHHLQSIRQNKLSLFKR